MTSGDKDLPALGSTWRDRAAALARGAAGTVPIVGPILAEVIGQVIPNQRIDRLERYVRLLSERLASAEKGQLEEKLRAPENVDLFEDGAIQAVRALSEERKAYIARLVATGIAGDEAKRLQSKRLLALLGEIDDAQVIILASHLERHLHDAEFRRRHAAVLEPKVATKESTPEEVDEATVHRLTKHHLVRLGLLRPRKFGMTGRLIGPVDEEDIIASREGTELTPLGRLLLREIGVAAPDEH